MISKMKYSLLTMNHKLFKKFKADDAPEHSAYFSHLTLGNCNRKKQSTIQYGTRVDELFTKAAIQPSRWSFADA